MKIIIPIPGGIGNQGGWRVLSKLASSWVLKGHEVVFLVHKSSSNPYFPTSAKIIWYNNSGELVDNADVNYKRPLLGYFYIAYAMVKALNKFKADVVLSTLSLSTLPIWFSKIKSKKVYYVQAYEPDYYKGINPIKLIYRLLSKLSYYLGIPIIVNSKFYFNYKGIKSERCVYPGIDFAIFNSLDTKTIDKNKTIILGTIGRIEKYKGTFYILEAYKKLRDESNLNIELHIAFGDKNLEKIDGVRVCHFKGDEKLSEFYKSIDIYICGGTYQLGAVHYPVIESMACGIPLITTGYYPTNEDNAWLVPIKNSNLIADQVQNIIENPELVKIKTKLALLDVKQFDWELVSNTMIDYFKEL